MINVQGHHKVAQRALSILWRLAMIAEAGFCIGIGIFILGVIFNVFTFKELTWMTAR